MMMTARGGNLLGYYMYHGGTQFVGKRGNTGLMAFSYDFLGALREFGQTSPIYDYLKPANFFLEDFPELLAPTVVALPANPVVDKANTTDLRYGARVNGESGFLFLNNYQDRVKMTEKKGLNINLAFKGRPTMAGRSSFSSCRRAWTVTSCSIATRSLTLRRSRRP